MASGIGNLPAGLGEWLELGLTFSWKLELENTCTSLCTL
jgi:hypothetical protein